MVPGLKTTVIYLVTLMGRLKLYLNEEKTDDASLEVPLVELAVWVFWGRCSPAGFYQDSKQNPNIIFGMYVRASENYLRIHFLHVLLSKFVASCSLSRIKI